MPTSSWITRLSFVSLLLSISTKVSSFQPSIHTSDRFHWPLNAGPVGQRGRGRAPPRQQENKPTMNQEITFNELRVVTPSPNGKDLPLGVMSKAEAMAKAKELGDLDLILINGNSDPPVCKIVDYSKYRYMQEKKAKEVKKNSKTSELKEVKMSYKIDVHDYDVRRKNALKFLRQGNRVKCTVMFRGREIQHDKLGVELLERLATDLDETCAREGRPKREGRNISLILSPRAEIMKAINTERRALDKAKKQRKDAGLIDEEEENDDDSMEQDAPKDDEAAASASKASRTLEKLLQGDEFY